MRESAMIWLNFRTFERYAFPYISDVTRWPDPYNYQQQGCASNKPPRIYLQHW